MSLLGKPKHRGISSQTASLIMDILDSSNLVRVSGSSTWICQSETVNERMHNLCFGS